MKYVNNVGAMVYAEDVQSKDIMIMNNKSCQGFPRR